MKIFVVGRSQSAKTPFADRVADALRCPRVGASEWFRNHFPGEGLDRQAFTDAITAFSLEVLRRDPDVNVRYLREKRLPSGLCIVEGVRNPRDFAHLFDYREDRVVFLSCDKTTIEETLFETGIAVIRALVRYWVDCGLLGADRVTNIHMADFAEIDAVADRYVDDLGSVEGVLARIHAEVNPIHCCVRAEYLHDMDSAMTGQLVTGCIFEVSSYPGSVPTFGVLLDDGSVFSYLPPHAILDFDRWRNFLARGEAPLDPEDLAYHACPSGDFCLHAYRALAGEVQAYFKRPDRWVRGWYRLTLDWHEGNDLLHLVALENGQYAFLPQHKLKFGEDAERVLPPFKKLHASWEPKPR